MITIGIGKEWWQVSALPGVTTGVFLEVVVDCDNYIQGKNFYTSNVDF